MVIYIFGSGTIRQTVSENIYHYDHGNDKVDLIFVEYMLCLKARYTSGLTDRHINVMVSSINKLVLSVALLRFEILNKTL